jgi:hypothetical protein
MYIYIGSRQVAGKGKGTQKGRWKYGRKRKQLLDEINME